MTLVTRGRWSVLLLVLGSCASAAPAPSPEVPDDSSVVVLPLTGPMAGARAEISGMTWDGDRLILLPQYPHRFRDEGDDGALFFLTRAELERATAAAGSGDGVPPLSPRRIPVQRLGRAHAIRGYEGLEAIAIRGDRAWLTVEATLGGRTAGHLASGHLTRDPDGLVLDTVLPQPVRPGALGRTNLGEEALVLSGDRLVVLSEVNGGSVRPSPAAELFGLDLRPRGTLPLPAIEYRITDATELDERGRFWVVNYFWPGDTILRAAADPLAECAGRRVDPTFATPVERLVELEIDDGRIRLTGRPPRYLAPPGVGPRVPHNWEAVARIRGGVLVATDQHPGTRLVFVPLPERDGDGARCRERG